MTEMDYTNSLGGYSTKVLSYAHAPLHPYSFPSVEQIYLSIGLSFLKLSISKYNTGILFCNGNIPAVL